MKRITRLTESDLNRIVKRVINESKKAPSLQKVYNKIWEVLSGMGYDKFNEEFDIQYIQWDDTRTEYPGPARYNYGKYVGTYLFRIAFYLEDNLNIKMIAEKVMNELNDEFGSEFFKLGDLYDRYFIINFDKLALKR